MANGRIDENGLPVYAPGDYDFVRVVDRSTGASRNALAPEVTAAARAISGALAQIVADAEDDIAPLIAGLGYLPPVPFASGLTVDSSRFTVSHGGEVYAPVADALPFTTTSTFNPTQWRVIQGVVGPDLASPTGAAMVGFKQAGAGAVGRDLQAKVREVVTPMDFGAVGDGVADDTAAVQRFLDYIAGVHVANASLSGRFRITDTIRVAGTPSIHFATKTLTLNAHFYVDMNVSEKKPALYFEYVRWNSFPGAVYIEGASANWQPDGGGRTLYNGIEFGPQSAGINIGTIFVQWAHKWGYFRSGSSIGGQQFVAGFHANRCGPSTTSAERPAITYTITSHSHNGLTGNTERSIVTVNKALPVGFDTSCYIIADEAGSANPYAVTNVISDTEFEVFPRMDEDFASNPDVLMVFGGGVYQDGNGAGLWYFGVVNCILTATVWMDRCLYGSMVGSMHGNASLLGGVLGTPPTTPVYGGHIGKCYFEGTVINAGFITSNEETTHFIGEARLLRDEDCFTARGNGGGAYFRGKYGGFIEATQTRTLSGKSITERSNEEPTNSWIHARPTNFPIGTKFSGSAGSKNINLYTPPSSSLQNGYSSIAIFASNPDGSAATRDWTFSSADDATIEGGPSKVYNSIGAVRLFLCVYDPSSHDWKVHAFSANNETYAEKSHNWPSLANGAMQSTTVAVPGAAIGNYATARMSVPLGGTQIWAEVTAPDTVTVYQRNDTGAAVDVAAGFLRVVVGVT